MLNLKEAYSLLSTKGNMELDSIWKRIWYSRIWLKITFFLWLARLVKLLTRDKIWKKGLSGSSCYSLCHKEEETIDHRSISCPQELEFLGHRLELFKSSDRSNNSLRETIETWRWSLFKNLVVKRAWYLSQGLVLWNIWKARNRVIFHLEPFHPLMAWKIVIRNIQETLTIG